MHVTTRFVRLFDTVRWLTPLTGSRAAAFGVVLRRKLDSQAIFKGKFEQQEFRFRSSDCNALFEVFHESEYSFLGDQVCSIEAPIVLDVGAHIGSFALWVLSRNSSAHVVSVEADPGTFSILAQNQALTTSRWEIINRAASNADGEKLQFSTEGPTMSHRISSEGTLWVESVSLRHLISTAGGPEGMIDLLKVDIEGAEELFICSSPQSLARVRTLVIELHPGLCDTDRVRAAIAPYFGRIEEITGRNSTKPLLFCSK